MKKILALTDFAEYTHSAMHYAVQLALKTGAVLTILDSSSKFANIATQNLSLFEFIEKYVQSGDGEVRMYFSSLRNFFRENDFQKINICYQSYPNFDIDNVVEFANNERSDLVILSSKEKSGIRNILFRSKVDALIAKANCPILVVPKKANYLGEIKELVLATNLEKEGTKAIEWIHDLSQSLEANYRFLHIVDEKTRSDKNRKMDFQLLVGELVGSEEFNFVEIQADSVLTGLKKYTESHKNSILTMFKRDKSTLDKWLTVDFTEKMAFVGHSPILIFRENMPIFRRQYRMVL